MILCKSCGHFHTTASWTLSSGAIVNFCQHRTTAKKCADDRATNTFNLSVYSGSLLVIGRGNETTKTDNNTNVWQKCNTSASKAATRHTQSLLDLIAVKHHDQ